jgi:adenosine 3'-phospho 5'-phosphosulfate transporter B3
MTLILSFLLFPKPFSWFYVFGATLVLGGLMASSLFKIKKKKNQEQTSDEEEGVKLIPSPEKKENGSKTIMEIVAPLPIHSHQQ